MFTEQDQQRVRRRLERFLAGQLDLSPASTEAGRVDAAPERKANDMAPVHEAPARGLAPNLPNGSHANLASPSAEQ